VRTAITTSTKALLASFKVSYLISKTKKPHTIGETLLPAAMKMCEIMHGEKYGEALKTIPLSNNTVMRRIESVSEDIKEQLLTRFKCSPIFALQIDESTDVAGLAQLLLSDTVSKKTSRNSSCSVYRFQRDVQGVIYSRQ
jgi:tetrahydromethanopterin S-methyltransferase subunit F